MQGYCSSSVIFVVSLNRLQPSRASLSQQVGSSIRQNAIRNYNQSVLVKMSAPRQESLIKPMPRSLYNLGLLPDSGTQQASSDMNVRRYRLSPWDESPP